MAKAIYSELFEQVKHIIARKNILPLQQQANQIDRIIRKKNTIDIAILGEFNVGKSSFINSFTGREVLPVGVIPVTSVITAIGKGDTEKATVTFSDGHRKETTINRLNDYINESENPGNSKRVESVEVKLPDFDLPGGLQLIDTPGLGSFLKHNTETTREWFANIGVAIIAISAERPLGENEVKLLNEIAEKTPEIVVLLTKTDLLPEKEVTRVETYIRRNLQSTFGKEFAIFRYSTKKGTAELTGKIIRQVIDPLHIAFDDKRVDILNHKIVMLTRQCIAYLDIARIAALHSEEEQKKLQDEIFSRRNNRSFFAREIALILSDQLNGIRDKLLKILLPEQNQISTQLQTLFETEYKTWNGNLYRRTRKFEQWMHAELNRAMIRLAANHEREYQRIVEKAGDHFIFFATSFRNGLNEKIKNVLGTEMPDKQPDMSIEKIKKPDILVGWTFDNHLDLLWFLFPMSLLGKMFGLYFKNSIPREVEINIYRLASTLTANVSITIRKMKDQTWQYITNELETIEALLTGTTDESKIYEKLIAGLQKQLKDDETKNVKKE